MSTGFIKYLKNTSWILLERSIRLIVLLLINIYIARYLGPDQLGLLSYATSFVAIFMIVASLGLDSIVIRELVTGVEKKSEIMGTAFLLKVIATFCMWLLLGLILLLKETDTITTDLILIIAFSSIFNVFSVIDYSFQAEVKSKYVVMVLFTQVIISSLLKLLIIYLKLPLIWFAHTYIADNLIVAIGLCIIYLYNKYEILSWKWKSCLALKLLRSSWPLIFSGLAVTMYMRIDQIMIKEMVGNRDAGIYAVAVQLSEAWYFIPMAISSSLYPAIIAAKTKGKALYHKQLQDIYSILIWIAILISTTTTVLSPWLITLLYGSEFTESSHILNIIIWSSVFVSIGIASGKWLINEHMQKFALYRTLVGLITNVVLNYLLITKYGVYGAAVATLISQLIVGYLFDIIHKKTRISFLLKTRGFIYPFMLMNKYV